MRSAPPVLVPVGRFVWGGRIVGLLALATLAVGLLAGWPWDTTPWRAGLTVGVWALATLLASWAWRCEALPPGELSWDGQAWWYRPGDAHALAVQLTLQWDAGEALLLQLRSPALGRFSRYAWLQASRLPTQWHGLRCAVHAGDTL